MEPTARYGTLPTRSSSLTTRMVTVTSSQPEHETSGTKSTPTHEPAADGTSSSEATPAELETELEQLLAASAPAGPEETPDSTRRFSLIVTGTVPGLDLQAERHLVIQNVERALLGLGATHGITLRGAAYRSDPLAEPFTSGATDTALDAAVTERPSEQDGSSSSEPSSPGSPDGSPSDPTDSDSTSTSDAT